MGFTSGLLGGIALTSSILYLSVAIHRQNRLQQSTILQQQDRVLRNVLDPAPPAPPPVARQVRAGLIERAKDMWNAEIEMLMRKVNDTDWDDVRARWEQKLEHTVESVSHEVAEKLPSKSDIMAPLQTTATRTTHREG